MILRIFKSNHPYVIFLIPVLGILMWSLSFIQQVSVNLNSENYTYLYNLLISPIEGKAVLNKIIGLLLLILQSFILIRLNFKYIFIDSKTYLPSVLFIIYGSCLLSYQQLYPALVANFFLLFAINKSFVYDKEKNCFKRYFEAGFLLGMSVLFYVNSIYLLILIWLTIIVLRTFNWREWMSSVIGLITPTILYASVMFLTDNTKALGHDFSLVMNFKNVVPDFSIYSKYAFGVLMFILFLGLVKGLQFVGLKKISSRKYFSLFFWFLVLLFGLFIIHPGISYELIAFVAIPISIIQSQLFLEIRKAWVREVIFVLNFLAIVSLLWFN